MSSGGTGQKLTFATTIVSGVFAFVATILSMVSIVLQAKNYRKPLLQRYVVRILLMVPIYSVASWTSMVSLQAAQFVDPIRDIYEAFTIYTFFQLLINYLGGERSLLIMTQGREPINHLWPLNHLFPPIDISDPHTFLGVKRGILQYAWLKPILSLAAIIMKATDVYQEGYVGVSSGYFWSSLIYNISVTASLYFLGLFWVCMHNDLLPFRPVPKFLCIKLIIFASYWQGFLLSILVWLGAIPDDVKGYTPDNLAAAIQDALICIEMPVFAVAHWYAFSWKDFADRNVLAARMPVKFALRDAFGARDLIEDTKETFKGDQYKYRYFDSGDHVMPHQESRARLGRLREGMRYQRGGKGKYWIPTPGQVDRQVNRDLNERDPLLSGTAGGPSEEYNFANGTFGDVDDTLAPDSEEEMLYERARQLVHGDWNYPVITAHEPLRERFMSSASSTYRYQEVPSDDTPASGSRRGSRSTVTGPKETQKANRAPTQFPSQAPKPPPKDTPPQASPPPRPPPKDGREAQTGPRQDRSPPESAEHVSHHATSESSPWAASGDGIDGEEYSRPQYQVEDEDEFRNVWGGGGGGGGGGSGF